MKTILVVDDEKMILRLATEALKTYSAGYNVLSAEDGKQAVKILKSASVDLVLTDLKMPVMDGYELLSYMSRNHRDIPIIVMTAFGSPEIAARLKQKGVTHYIEKPFDLNILKEKISEVFTARSKGFIHGFTLANFLQAVEVEQKTTTLAIQSKGRSGFLHLEKGELLDADTENLKGEEAAIEIICWDDAAIEIQPLQKKQRTIHSSLMHILLEASKVKDEKEHTLPPHESQLEEAIRLAEGHHFKEAQDILVNFLRSNPRSARGWLWYSRVIVALKSIEASLNNAAKLAPGNAEIVEEIRKFNMASVRITTDQIRRCPFCWTPLNINAFWCISCRTHLLIHDRFFSSPRDADKDIIKKAIERYTKVISREKSINAFYYLSIAHLNLQNWEEALNLLHKTVNLAPDRKIFSDQLRRLLKHMASKQTGFEEEAPKPEIVPESASVQEEAKKKKILVVEDSSTTRKIIAITLGQKGYEIIEARDGLEALGKLNDEKPDLILLDIILPKMDGYKILSIIKGNSLFKEIPVIMLTSRDSFMSKVKGRLAGSAAYLTKPFDPKQLVETIEKYLK